MQTKDWHLRTRALAVAFLRRAMAAANIEHSHLDDATLSAAVDKASSPGVWVVDEEGAKEWVDFCAHYDFTLAQAALARQMCSGKVLPSAYERLPWRRKNRFQGGNPQEAS